ncbi:MAG: hypothetical protein WC338_08040 [Candidatus Ratteibacteria bacterium]|jgi:hypothetical protein
MKTIDVRIEWSDNKPLQVHHIATALMEYFKIDFTVRELPAQPEQGQALRCFFCDDKKEVRSGVDIIPCPACSHVSVLKRSCKNCGDKDCALSGDKETVNQTPCKKWQPIPAKVDDKNLCAVLLDIATPIKPKCDKFESMLYLPMRCNKCGEHKSCHAQGAI